MGDGRMVRVAFQSNQLAVLRQGTGEMDAAISAERANFQNPLCSHAERIEFHEGIDTLSLRPR